MRHSPVSYTHLDVYKRQVVITAGVPIGQSGTTNLIKAQVVGEKI